VTKPAALRLRPPRLAWAMLAVQIELLDKRKRATKLQATSTKTKEASESKCEHPQELGLLS